jgi:hypothetical protein
MSSLKGDLQSLASQNRGRGKAGSQDGEKYCGGFYATCLKSNRWTNAVYV